MEQLQLFAYLLFWTSLSFGVRGSSSSSWSFQPSPSSATKDRCLAGMPVIINYSKSSKFLPLNCFLRALIDTLFSKQFVSSGSSDKTKLVFFCRNQLDGRVDKAVKNNLKVKIFMI